MLLPLPSDPAGVQTEVPNARRLHPKLKAEPITAQVLCYR